MPITKMRRALPNLITASRLVLVVPLGSLLWVSRHSDRLRWMVIALFLWIAFSDWLDGFLARRFSAQSALGRVMDPAADKVLALVCFLVLVRAGMDGHSYFPLPLWLAAVVVGKDLWCVIGYLVIRMMGVEIAVRPAILGKASTFLQLALVGSIVIGPELVRMHLGWSREVLVWLTAIMTTLAGINYSVVAVRRLATAQLHE
ncbi:MAG: CDP-alcohol phosphatidyltransferase family protein [Phycisphaerae bacterium]|nr:CDP-alcohol phosphatidyltransferase family protein [Phycisphaerae bacterium]